MSSSVTRRARKRLKRENAASACLAICFLASIGPLKAQYIGDQLPGLSGLKAGSQPAPGVYVTLPLYFRYSNITINGAQGNQVLKNLTAGINLFVLPGVEVITPFKILGATYGAAYMQWINNGVLDVASPSFHRVTSYHFGDIYVQPVILGWHTPRADITAGYAFFAPTGSAGQHMWVNEIDLGATVYPDSGKKWNLATMMFYDFNRQKNSADITVGNILTLTGGIGRSFLKGAANAGVAYGAQWKITHDSGSSIPAFVPITNGRVFGVGPEIELPVFQKDRNLGLISFRYVWLVGPKAALGGQTLALSFTFGRLSQQ